MDCPGIIYRAIFDLAGKRKMKIPAISTPSPKTNNSFKLNSAKQANNLNTCRLKISRGVMDVALQGVSGSGLSNTINGYLIPAGRQRHLMAQQH